MIYYLVVLILFNINLFHIKNVVKAYVKCPYCDPNPNLDKAMGLVKFIRLFDVGY